MSIVLMFLGFALGWFYCSLFTMGKVSDLRLEIAWLRQELTEAHNFIDGREYNESD